MMCNWIKILKIIVVLMLVIEVVYDFFVNLFRSKENFFLYLRKE